MPDSKGRFVKGDKARAGKTWPLLTCTNCGATKTARRFPKRGGIYKKYGELHPKRYDNQCKRCRKPARPGQPRNQVTEPKLRVTGEKKKKPKSPSFTRNERKNRVRQETRIQSMIYLAKHGCEDCGERDPRKLEYDHKDPDHKRAPIANLIRDGYSWISPTIRNEIAKCRVLCASCHRVHTIKQQGYYAADAIQETLGKLAARYKFSL